MNRRVPGRYRRPRRRSYRSWSAGFGTPSAAATGCRYGPSLPTGRLLCRNLAACLRQQQHHKMSVKPVLHVGACRVVETDLGSNGSGTLSMCKVAAASIDVSSDKR